MIYIKGEQNQKILGTYINNNYTNVIKSRGDSQFKTKQTKTQNTERLKIRFLEVWVENADLNP